MYIKAEGITQFDIFHVSVENSVNSEFCFFWALLKPFLSSWKDKLQWTQKSFGPIIRKILTWIFRIIKAHGPKLNPHPAPGCNRSPPTMYFQKMQFLGVFRPFFQRSLTSPSKSTLGKVAAECLLTLPLLVSMIPGWDRVTDLSKLGGGGVHAPLFPTALVCIVHDWEDIKAICTA